MEMPPQSLRFNQAMHQDLKLGDVVVLKSGGNNMTITHISQGSNPSEVIVECTWFEGPLGDQREKHSSFPIEALKKTQKARNVTTPPEIREGLRKMKSPLTNERQNGLDQLVSNNAADELAKLLGNRNAEIRQLAAIGLAKLQYFPALPQLIDGLCDIGKKRSKEAAIEGVDELLPLFGEAAFEKILIRLPQRIIHTQECNRWVKALAGCMNENQANKSLQHSLDEFNAKGKDWQTITASGHSVASIVHDHFEIILRASIASKKNLSPKLLIQAATAYGNRSSFKITRRKYFAEWLAESGVNYSPEVNAMISDWARTSVKIFEHDVREEISKGSSANDLIKLLEFAFKLNALNNEHLESIVDDATLPELKAQLSDFRTRRTLNDY
jgi:uncharacterized protein YodC (DUF2158 family)